MGQDLLEQVQSTVKWYQYRTDITITIVIQTPGNDTFKEVDQESGRVRKALDVI